MAGRVVVVVVEVVVVSGDSVGEVDDSGGAASTIVVSVGAGVGGSVVWLSPLQDASIRSRIRAARRIGAAYTAAVTVLVSTRATKRVGRKETQCLLTHHYLLTTRLTG